MKQIKYLTFFILALIFCNLFISANSQKKKNSAKKSINKESRSVALLAMIMHLWKPSKYSFKLSYKTLNRNCGRSIRHSKLSKTISTLSKKANRKVQAKSTNICS